MKRKRISRRTFVGDVATGLSFTIVPRHVLGRGFVPPSDKLNVACIGVGGMGASDVRGVGKTENVYALCDVDDRQAAQAFAAYEQGRLLRWGPVSSGRRAYPTPSGLFHLNWRSRGRHSSVNPQWYMEWYFNFDNVRGFALHSYTLPGYPASHACVRLLERDAIWIYEWGDGWTLGKRGQVLERGTPLLIVGQYGFDAQPPWRSLEHLARGIDLPEAPLPNHVEHGVMEETVGGDQSGISQ